MTDRYERIRKRIAGRVADWLMSNPVTIAVLVVLVTTTLAAAVSR
jgi:hypothetical protein